MEAGNVGQRWGERGGSLGGVQRGPGPSAGGRQALSACGSFDDCAGGDVGRAVGSTGDRALGPQAEPGGLGGTWNFARSRACAFGVERAFPGAGCGRAGTAPRGLGEGGGGSRGWGGFAARGAGAAGHVAIDGKRLRGSAVGDGPGVHLLAAFSERLQGVIGQLRVAPEANEITAALTLLKTLPIEGAIISGDAILAQTDLCRLIIERGGDYFFTVKSNQPTLEADIALAFRPDSPLCGVGARA